MLTRASLQAWEYEIGLACNEYQERAVVAGIIRNAARRVASQGASTDTLFVPGDLVLSNFVFVTHLPAGIVIGGSLICSALARLTHLPEGLSVGHNLDCGRCSRLTHLPDAMHVGGDIKIDYCFSLVCLPETLNFGGNLSCLGCYNLVRLPEAINRWGYSRKRTLRQIDIRNTGVSLDIQVRLVQAKLTGLQFDYGLILGPPDRVFSGLGAAVDFWYQGVSRSAVPQVAIWTDVPACESEALKQFLERLAGVVDHESNFGRARLVAWVRGLLDDMHQSPARRRMCSAGIRNLSRRREDRIIWEMNKLEILSQLFWAQDVQDEGATLKALVLGLMCLRILEAHARRKAKNLVVEDEYEIYLSYRMQLGSKLDLPLLADGVLHEPSCSVTSEDVAAALADVWQFIRNPSGVQTYVQTSA